MKDQGKPMQIAIQESATPMDYRFSGLHESEV